MTDERARPDHRREAGHGTSGSSRLQSSIARLTTRDADEHHAWIAARYGDHGRRVRPRARAYEFSSEAGALAGLALTRTTYTAVAAEVSWPPVSFVDVGHLRSGRCLMRWAGNEVRLADRGTLLFPPYGYVHVHDCSDTSWVTLTMDVLLRVAEEITGLDRTQVRFTGLRPLSPAVERQWLATADYVQRGIRSRALSEPLVLAAAEQLTAASLLSTFPNTTMSTDVRGPRDPATPGIVRRAMAFIDANADRAITLTDIASAAGVVPRTLQYAFRRHRDTTPHAYLRQVRLARAHDELLAAEPGDRTSVAVVAARWGYARPHRFAAAYRQAYGQPPARTLRS